MIVLDASVVLKWFLDEKDSPEAIKFLELHIRGSDEIAVPELLYYEVANVLVTRTTLPGKAILSALRNLLGLELASYSLGAEEYMKVAQLALSSHITVYDAVYPVLAEKLGADFITADRKLAENLKDLKFITVL